MKKKQLESLKDFKLDAERVKDIQASLKGGDLGVKLDCVRVSERDSLSGSYLYD